MLVESKGSSVVAAAIRGELSFSRKERVEKETVGNETLIWKGEQALVRCELCANDPRVWVQFSKVHRSRQNTAKGSKGHSKGFMVVHRREFERSTVTDGELAVSSAPSTKPE